MPNFKYMESAKIVVKPIPAIIPVVFQLPDGSRAPHPELLVLPATEENGPYWAARQQAIKGKIFRGQSNAEVRTILRAMDRKLYPKHIITGWTADTVVEIDPSGAVVPCAFTEAGAVDLVEAFPDDVFESLRDYCSDGDRWRKLNIEQLAKNS